MPYFPYSRQSKKKAHRGAIVARMVANLMKVAGVDHVVTIDLHATQMQGFFKCPIDNLTAEPLLTRWVRQNIKNWEDSVVVSKNPGGTKRATSLADKLNLSFGIVTTDQRKPKYPSSMLNSMVLDGMSNDGTVDAPNTHEEPDTETRHSDAPRPHDWAHPPRTQNHQVNGNGRFGHHHQLPNRNHRGITSNPAPPVRRGHINGDPAPSPLAQTTRPPSAQGEQQGGEQGPPSMGIPRATTVPSLSMSHHVESDGYEEPEDPDNDSDEAPRDVITGRLIHGHIVDDDVPSPTASQYSTARNHRTDRKGSSDDEEPPEHMLQSFTSVASSQWGMHDGGLGGTMDANHSDEEEEDNFHNPEIETRVTLVGNVREKPVIIVDDMIDKAGSWIAAAETVVKRGGATKVFCMATHGLFGGDSLQQLDECDEIEAVIVTNSFPISEEKRRSTRKLIVLDVSNLLSEAIRRNHHGESISGLYYLMD